MPTTPRQFEEAIKNVFDLLPNSVLSRTFFLSQLNDETLTVMQVLNQKNGCNLYKDHQLNVKEAY